jgi:AbrB family transcriptional regulator (stage V sporulation protein T)
MKATGVVRRIDDLGRIVIPKEIRKSLRIREGDSLEIYTDGSDSIVLKKYSHVENINNFIIQYVDAVYTSSKRDIIVTDTERVIAAAGNFRKDLLGKKISYSLDEKIQKRTLQKIEKGENLEITDNFIINQAAVLKPISVYGDIIGATIIIGENTTGEIERSLVEITSIFIGKYLES